MMIVSFFFRLVLFGKEYSLLLILKRNSLSFVDVTFVIKKLEGNVKCTQCQGLNKKERI